MKKLWFVAGTDTGVGKTVCAAGILGELRKRGVRACGVKPFSSGAEPGALPPDAARLEEAAGSGEDPALLAPVRFRAPLAPLAAARAEGVEVDVARAEEAVDELLDRWEVVVMEGIGGVLVPLRPLFPLLSFAARWRPDTLVVGRPGLGTLNHTLLTVRALQDVRIPVRAVALSRAPDAPSDASEASNPALLREWLGRPVLSVPALGPGVPGPFPEIVEALLP